MDLNRETVEYICTRFQSPHLSRRFGHKLYAEDEDPFLRAMRALSEVQYAGDSSFPAKYPNDDIACWQDRSPEPEVEERPGRRREAISLYLEPTRGQDWPRPVSPSSRDRERRDLARNVRLLSHLTSRPPLTGILQTRSWKSSQRTPALTDRRTLRDIPRIFIFHGSTLKNYFKGWNR